MNDFLVLLDCNEVYLSGALVEGIQDHTNEYNLSQRRLTFEGFSYKYMFVVNFEIFLNTLSFPAFNTSFLLIVFLVNPRQELM